MNTNIENYLMIAQNALIENNFTECENYVNKILEIESDNTDAYLLKIKALSVKQQHGYDSRVHKIPEYEFVEQIYEQKYEYYTIIIDKCAFLERHLKSIVGIMIDDFFGECRCRYQALYTDKMLSTDLLIHAWKQVKNCSDDEIVQDLLQFYFNAKEDSASAAWIFLKACIKNKNYNLSSKTVAENFYRELIRGEIREILECFPEVLYTVKELVFNSGLIDDDISDIEQNIESIRMYLDELKIHCLEYDLYDDEIVVLNDRVAGWIELQDMNYATIAYEKIKKINPNYPVDSQIENSLQLHQNSSRIPKKSGCYIATCVYGTYDCPEVWTLRRFRDFKLSESWYGRTFIRMYYSISPRLVKWFGHTKWFQKLWKTRLDKMVSELKKQGYEDTKYEDRF